MNKNIFEYHDGTATVWGDPLEIHHQLAAALDGDINKVLLQARSDCRSCRNRDPQRQHCKNCGGSGVEPHTESVRYEALTKLVPAIRLAFVLPEFDRATGQGATWRICLKAFSDFVAWENEQKKNGAIEPASSSAVEAPTA